MKNKILFFFLSFFTILIACSKDETPTQPAIILLAPTATAPENITGTSFLAKWTFVSGASGYSIDVSSNSNFTSFVPGFQSKVVNDLSTTVNGLSAGVDYYYRVKATKGDASSPFSNIVKLSNPNTALKVKAGNNFFVGAAVSTNRLSGSYNTILTTEFSSITAENEMKMREIWTGPTTFNWTNADALVNYAMTNNLNVHGHALIWHESVPTWLASFAGTNAEFEDLVRTYITTVVTRYKDKVKSWDVVNEAIKDGGGTRASIFLDKLGPNYIAKCFGWARAADSDCILFYNDYNTPEDINKQNGVYALIDQLKAANVPIDGIGMQMHVNYNTMTDAELKADFNKAISRNLKIHVSELDVRTNNTNPVASTFTTERKNAQRAKVRQVVKLYNELPAANKYAVSVWGIKDNDSWIINLFGRPDWPLLFDATFARKDAHYGFLEGLD
jgi:endo-1,4-beta-xylanase